MSCLEDGFNVIPPRAEMNPGILVESRSDAPGSDWESLSGDEAGLFLHGIMWLFLIEGTNRRLILSLQKKLDHKSAEKSTDILG